jgi:hypothetical protein
MENFFCKQDRGLIYVVNYEAMEPYVVFLVNSRISARYLYGNGFGVAPFFKPRAASAYFTYKNQPYAISRGEEVKTIPDWFWDWFKKNQGKTPYIKLTDEDRFMRGSMAEKRLQFVSDIIDYDIPNSPPHPFYIYEFVEKGVLADKIP